MKRILISLAVVAGFLPAPAFALGIGELTLESGLNEPFEARIALLSITREELDTLNIGLADNEAFRRAGVDRPFVLSNLRFELVETESGADHIRVSSRDSIREPFLNFLVEVSWSKGRLYREYTVLLDPPLFDSRAAPAYARAPSAPVSTAPAPVAQAAQVETGAEYTAAPAFTGSEYGPTESTDTLWSVAGRTRPDAGVTVQQMMLALLRANPEAFISGNVNGLRRGQILKIPGRDDIDAVAPDEAMAEVKSQYALWEDISGTIASAPQERPQTTPAAAAPAAETAPAAVAVEDTTELRLVAAADTGAGTDQGGGASGAEAGQLRDRLALASEQVATVSQENTELKDKLTESEAIIADLKRLIALKDDELAALQQQMAAGAAAVPAAPVPVEAPAVQPAEEEADEAEAAPAAIPPETGAEPIAQEPVPEETGTAAPEAAPPVSQAPAPEKPAATQKPAAPAPAPAEPAPTLIDQVIEFVTGNLIIIGAAVGAIVLLIAGIAAVGKFRSRLEASAAAAPLEEFPDFAGDEGEAELPADSEEVTGVREQPARSDHSAAATPAAKEDATVFALPPEPKAKAAAGAKAVAESAQPTASAEEVLDAFHHEVNVFMAYEDWDQAEQFVRDSIGREPNNLDFHAKLLEVFFTSGNRRKYEAAAKALHDVVGGAGPYWDNAVVMWQEMSPNRALFAAGGEEDEGPAATATGGGLLDLTAAASRSDAGLDFDLGEATAEPAAKPAAAAEDEPLLDITGAEGAAPEPSAAEEGADMLDVTAAVGLETEEPALELGPGAPAEGVLDLTGGSEQPAADLLDVSGSGGDLLDVTAQTDVGAQEIADEDLLDVTSTAASAREIAEEAAPAPVEESVGEHTLDFNLEDLPQAAAESPASESQSGGGNIIEFESSGGGLELDAGDEPGGLAADETSLGGGLELEAMIAEDAPDAGGLELDLTIDDLPAADEKAPADEIDMDGTVEIPKLELADEDEDDDEDGEDHTVFVPRSGEAQEQSEEDEIATKLDLAKAYLEMGDKESKESARKILDQVLADGTDQQKRKAQELIRRVS